MSQLQRARRAVALSYDQKTTPRVAAKGSGPIAEQIIERAREHGVPLQQEPELLELLAQVPLGDEVPESLYVAVARVLAFAYMIKGKALETRQTQESPSSAGQAG